MRKNYIFTFLLALLFIQPGLYAQTVYTLNWGSSFSPAWGAPSTSGTCTSIGGSGVNATVTMVSTGGAATFISPYPRVNGAGDFVVAGSSSAVEIDMNFNANSETMTSTFTFSQPISGVVMSISDIDKNTASSIAYFDSVVIVGSDGTNTILPTITKFNTGSNFTVVNGNTAYGNLVSGQGGNATSTAFDATSQQCTIIVDFGTAVIKSFTVLYGNPAIAQANPTLQAIAFGNINFSKTINVSGTVWRDVNGSAAGGFTGIQNGSETGTNAGGTLFANLVDAGTGKVLASVPVNADGTYSFAGVAQNINASVQISTTSGTFGTTAPATGTPATWTNTSPLSQPFNTGTAGTNITGKDFGIEQPPVSPNQTYTIAQPALNSFRTLNGTGAAGSPGPLSGADPEDGALGTGKTFNIVTGAGMNGNKLFYNGVQIVGAISIPNYDPTLLQVQFTGAGSSTLSFVYQSFDAAGKGSNFATYTINWLLALPVQQLELSAMVSGTLVTLNWKTANEINTSRYIAERSTDNSNFVTAGVVAAAGNSSGIKNYNLPDDISAVTGTVIYYRIKVVDADGKISYSNTVVVRLQGIDGVKIWPNPFTAAVNVAVFSKLNTSVEMRITDMAGKIITQGNYALVKGNNQLLLPNLQQLAKGVYLLHVKNNNGSISFVQKITKE